MVWKHTNILHSWWPSSQCNILWGLPRHVYIVWLQVRIRLMRTWIRWWARHLAQSTSQCFWQCLVRSWMAQIQKTSSRMLSLASTRTTQVWLTHFADFLLLLCEPIAVFYWYLFWLLNSGRFASLSCVTVLEHQNKFSVNWQWWLMNINVTKCIGSAVNCHGYVAFILALF